VKTLNLQTGKLGEEIARKYLENKGYRILEQNYKTKYAEIDLIAKKKNELVFVEVRTKTNEDFGSPEESLNNKKLRKIFMNAQAYVARTKWQGPYRIDAVCVVLDPVVLDSVKYEIARINHYENII